MYGTYVRCVIASLRGVVQDKYARLVRRRMQSRWYFEFIALIEVRVGEHWADVFVRRLGIA